MEGVVVILVLVVVIGIVIGLVQSAARKRALRQRRERLMASYGDEEVVNAIMAGQVWQGMTKVPLLESWGEPADTDAGVQIQADRKEPIQRSGDR